MAVKYHISPKTGNPNICRADPNNPRSKGCPLTDAEGNPPEHYSSKEEAREAYEKQQEERVLQEAEQRRNQTEIEREKHWPSPSPDKVKKYEDMGYKVDVEKKRLSLKGFNKNGCYERMSYADGFFSGGINAPGESWQIFNARSEAVDFAAEGENHIKVTTKMFESFNDTYAESIDSSKDFENHLEKLNTVNSSIGDFQKRANKMIDDSKDLFGEPDEASRVDPKMPNRFDKLKFEGYDSRPVTVGDHDTGNKAFIEFEDDSMKIVSLKDSNGEPTRTGPMDGFFLRGSEFKSNGVVESREFRTEAYSNVSPGSEKMNSFEWFNKRREMARDAIIDSRKIEKELDKK